MVFAVWLWTAVPALSVAASQAEHSSNSRRNRSQAFVSSPTAIIIYLSSLSDIFSLLWGAKGRGRSVGTVGVHLSDYGYFFFVLVLTNCVSGGKQPACFFFLPRRGNALQLCRLTALSAHLVLRRQVIADHMYRLLTHTHTHQHPPLPPNVVLIVS